MSKIVPGSQHDRVVGGGDKLKFQFQPYAKLQFSLNSRENDLSKGLSLI